jgi:hypothetical protein
MHILDGPRSAASHWNPLSLRGSRRFFVSHAAVGIRNVSGHPVLFARHTGDYGLAGIEPPSLVRRA